MPKGNNLTARETGIVDFLLAQGKSMRHIATELGNGRSAKIVFTRSKELRQGFKVQRTGVAKKVSARDKALIVRKIRNSSKSIESVRRELGLNVCNSTIRNTVKSAGVLKYRRKSANLI